MRFLNEILKRDKIKFKIPKSTQDIIPVSMIYEDGIFKHDYRLFSKCYKFSDINYQVASKEDKESMFLKYSSFLNSLDSSASSKLTIYNRKINYDDFENNISLRIANDNLDNLRDEYNEMLKENSKHSNEIIQEKIITATVNKNSIDEARSYFKRVELEMNNRIVELGSKFTDVSLEERLNIYYNFNRNNVQNTLKLNKDCIYRIENYKDLIAPTRLRLSKDHFRIGERYGRVLFLKDYANFIKDSMITELTDLNKNMMLSIDIIPIPMDEAVKEAESRKLGVETNITNWIRKQNENNNYGANIPYDMELERKESQEVLEDLTQRDQRMFLSLVTIVILADSKKELENSTESLKTIARKNLCNLSVLKYQQLDGLNTTIPYGIRSIEVFRTLITESLAVLMPFKVQEIMHDGGLYYGINAISKNMIVADRKKLLNGNLFILGVSGSGKSFMAKEEITSIILQDKESDVIIIDPENEFSKLTNALGGEVIKISSTSENHINAMDINKDYGDGANPVVLKSEFILSLCEQLIGSQNLGSIQKSIIDRCTSNVYRKYQQNNFMGKPPTLKEFREELLNQPEIEAKEIALSLELFTNGSLDTFAQDTNVNTNNRLICYNILELGKQLQPLGMLVILDSILNRISENRTKGKNTYIFIDEIYLLFQYEYSANFLFSLWKRVRKYGAYCTGITQNIEDLLQSHIARTMLANSEFLIMLNQASTDKIELAKLLNISDLQMSYITNSGVGEGLIKVGDSIIPFKNRFPKDTKLYKLMTTKIGEDIF